MAFTTFSLSQSFFGGLNVSVEFTGDRAIVAASTPEEWQECRQRSRKLLRFCQQENIPLVEYRLIVDHMTQHRVVASIRDIAPFMKDNILYLDSAGLYQLFNEAAQSQQHLSLVNNLNQRGILTVANEGHSGVTIPQWVGQNLSSYWEPDNLRRYLEAIELHGELRDYEWTAFRMDEKRKQIRQTGTIQRVMVWGYDCRLVKVHQCEIIG